MVYKHRRVPLLNFLFFGGLALLAVTLAMVVNFVLNPPIGGYIAANVTAAAFLIIFLIIFIRWLISAPDAVSVHGALIWAPDKQTAQEACNYLAAYVFKLPEVLVDHYHLGRPIYERVNVDSLTMMLQGARIDLRNKPISLFSRFGWATKDKAGLQQGKSTMVYVKTTISDSALVHELHHMIDEIILKKLPDYAHAEKDWWALVPRTKQLLKEGAVGWRV